MEAEIITVGTEILMGQIVNTNAQFISKNLADIGVSMYYQTTVGDNARRLKKVVVDALNRSDVVILTGGLGPTEDDMTKEIVAQVMGYPLVLYEDIAENIKSYFIKVGKEMTLNNLKQAKFPENCIILENKCGTAPGCIMEKKGKAAILLPGPPKELIPMFNDSVMPYLEKINNTKFYSKMIRIFNVGESAVEAGLIDLIHNQTNPTLATYASDGQVTLRVTAKCKNYDEGRELVEPVVNEVKNRFPDGVYSTDDESMEQAVEKLIRKKNLTLATAESCTGGLIASKLVSIPGSSEWFKEGAVTYSNDAKMRRLGVKAETLEKYGAVSEETAKEMAAGIARTSSSDIGISVTGIAGPGGGSEEKPVGLVYIGVSYNGKVYAEKFMLNGDRNRVRNMAAMHALNIVRRELLKNE